MGVGNFSEAINFLDKASEIAERLRDYRQWGESAALRAWTTYLVSDFEDSRARFERVYKMATQVGNVQYQNWGQWGQSHSLLRLNSLEEARHELQDVIQRLESGEDPGSHVVTYGLMSVVCYHLQDWEQMLKYARLLVSPDKNPDRFSIADLEGHASTAEVFLRLWEKSLTSDLLTQINLSLIDCQASAKLACKAASALRTSLSNWTAARTSLERLASLLRRQSPFCSEALERWIVNRPEVRHAL